VRRSGTHPSSPSSHLPADESPRPEWPQSRLVPCKCHTRVVDRTRSTVRNSRVFLHGQPTHTLYAGHVSSVRHRCRGGGARRAVLLPGGRRRWRHSDEDVPHRDDGKPHRRRPDTQLHVRVVRGHGKQAIRRDKEHHADDG